MFFCDLEKNSHFFMKYTKNHIACYDYFFERIDNLFSEEIFFNTIKKYED